MFNRLNKLSVLGITMIAAIYSAVTLSPSSTNAQESGCFMVTSSGQYLDLAGLCRKNPNVKRIAKPKAVSIARVSPKRQVFPGNFPVSSNNLTAFLQVIRYAEGTASADGYRIQYTGARFSSFGDHPRRVICGGIRGSQVCSSAAGAYQFLETTWDDVATAIGASDFSPDWQDRGAIELIRRSKALEDVEAGRIEEAIAKVAPVWASFPRYRGDYNGVYGQSVVSMEELLREFTGYLAGLGGSGSQNNTQLVSNPTSRYIRLDRGS
jgi:muramidase (phage lysozyme)